MYDIGGSRAIMLLLGICSGNKKVLVLGRGSFFTMVNSCYLTNKKTSTEVNNELAKD